MKSGYGRQSSAPDYELTRVEPDSPMGELIRRYWQPACTSDELRNLPRKEKLLCEDCRIPRQKKGRSGPSTCIAHIAASLSNEAGAKRRGCAAAFTAGFTIKRVGASTCRARPRSSASALRGMRLWGNYAVEMVRDCNWLQHYENIVDPVPPLILHHWISGDRFEGARMQGTPTIG